VCDLIRAEDQTVLIQSESVRYSSFSVCKAYFEVKLE